MSQKSSPDSPPGVIVGKNSRDENGWELKRLRLLLGNDSWRAKKGVKAGQGETIKDSAEIAT